ncbi:MAG TPA: purine-nucleoside phosphorylase [Candidatus Hydrogenedentes bacterium]|nr:purine-nucleoside phosphorylase [Candidatus Hydrogenedentota bacterium]
MATVDQHPIGIVAGSGIELNSILDTISEETPFSSVPELAGGGVEGHAYRFIRGRCGPAEVILQCGRFHAYEGFSFEEVVRPVQVMYEWGVRTIVFTNAAGGLLAPMKPGDLVAIDCIRTWPFKRFDLPESLNTDFIVPGCDFTGVYGWMHGPCYETRAEIRTLQSLGCAAVGMSAGPEVFRCHSLGICAAVISCITNSCVTPQVLTHQHVLETARNSSARLCEQLRAFIGTCQKT